MKQGKRKTGKVKSAYSKPFKPQNPGYRKDEEEHHVLLKYQENTPPSPRFFCNSRHGILPLPLPHAMILMKAQMAEVFS